MKPAAQLQACIELLAQIDATGYPADRCMAAYFKQRRYIGSKDKAAISEHLYTVLRNKLSYQYLLDQHKIEPHNRSLVAAMTCLSGKQVRDYFNGDRYSPHVLNTQQMAAFDQLQSRDLDHAPLNVRLNLPEWLMGYFDNALGDRLQVEMTAMNQQASTDIRVNTLKCSKEQLIDALQSVGHDVSQTRLSPWGLRFSKRVSLFGLTAFKQGWFEIQDQGSQLLALLSGVKPGDRVVDFCAGAGGKTLAMAAMMQNKGVIYASDVHTKRLNQLNKRTKRAGVHNVRVHTLSSEHDKWVKQHKGIADVVLVDAPCSGTGTWRRSPDARWQLHAHNLQNLIELQRSILRSAKRLLKPGGRLIYATCSLLNEENEQQASHFLLNNPEFIPCNFELTPALDERKDCFIYTGHQFRTLPALSACDGFFVACFMRQAAADG